MEAGFINRHFAAIPAALIRMRGAGHRRARERAEAAPVRADRTVDPISLREAFDTFTGASRRLEDTWQTLQARVDHLSSELARANQALANRLEAQKQQAHRQRALLAALPAGVIVFAADGHVAEANPAAERLLGMALAGRHRDAVQAALAQAEGDSHMLPVARPEQRVAITSEALPDGGAVMLIHDVTEAHAAREQRARRERLAAMGEMTARVAHQLRSPLATAVLYAGQLARRELADDERARLADKTLARLRHLERMTREVLRFARGDQADSGVTEVAALLDQARQVMAPLMAARGIAFHVADLAGEASVRGDAAALGCALTSLIENALQATPRGGKVHVTAMANHNRVLLTVADSGCGIAADALARVFEPFYTTRPEGTGLGLAIVRSTVEAAGGTIDVQSTPGEGTRFTLGLARLRGQGASVVLGTGEAA